MFDSHVIGGKSNVKDHQQLSGIAPEAKILHEEIHQQLCGSGTGVVPEAMSNSEVIRGNSKCFVIGGLLLQQFRTQTHHNILYICVYQFESGARVVPEGLSTLR